jgi:hypothetical protein
VKNAIRVFLAAYLALAGNSQVRENSKKPIHPDPGRGLKLVKLISIGNEGEGYYFGGARDIQLDAAGNLYLNDTWSSAQKAHLPKFSSDGKFIKDFYRQGEGPGEISSAYEFVADGSNLFLYDYMKRKIVVMDTDGNIEAEFKKETSSFDDFCGVYGDWLVIYRKHYPLERRTSRLYDIRNEIALLSKDGKTEKEVCSLINQMFYISSAQGGGGMPWDPFVATVGGNRLYVCSTQNYLIRAYDLETGKTVSSFKRDYRRVDFDAPESLKKFVSKYHAPKRKYRNDVLALVFDGKFLWVQTSTESKEKGVLYDLFDKEGRFVDSFYVNLKGRVLRIDGEFLYASLSDPNDLPLLVKYRIAEPLVGR